MLNHLERRLRQAEDGIEFRYRYVGSHTWRAGALIAADATGAVIVTPQNATTAIPWSALMAIRFPE